jgi:hypothetical protein
LSGLDTGGNRLAAENEFRVRQDGLESSLDPALKVATLIAAVLVLAQQILEIGGCRWC